MPCPCSTFAIASWEIRVHSLTHSTRTSPSLSRVNSKGGQASRVTFGGEKAEPPARRKGVVERIDPKIPNRKLHCRLPVGMWILSIRRFLMANGFFYFFIPRIVELFSVLNWGQIGDGDGERLKF